MQPAADKLAQDLAKVQFQDPELPVVTNVDAEPNRQGSRIAGLLVEQVTAPVRFTQMVEKLQQLGAEGVLEIGPGRVLTGLVARCDKKIRRSNLESWEDLQSAVEFIRS